jgi:hypothetical protein
MCGLIGFSGTSPFDVEKIKELILANVTRGQDATGMFNQKQVIKKAVNGVEFLADLSIVPENMFIGHCRAGTYGNKTDDKNAHPFLYDNFVTVHNGTLKSAFDLAKIVNWTSQDWDVDSQILAKAISCGKQYETFKALEGAAALIWANINDDNRIYLYRNSERPLFRGIVKNEGMYISSLDTALKIIGCEHISEIKTQCIFEVTNGSITKSTPVVIKNKKTTYDCTTKQFNYEYDDDGCNISKPYSRTLFGEDDKEYYVGRWIRYIGETKPSVVKGGWYMIGEKTTTAGWCKIYNDIGILAWEQHLNISLPKEKLVGGSLGVATLDIKYLLNINKGDVVAIKRVSEQDKKAVIYRLDNNKQGLQVPFSFVRPATNDEITKATDIIINKYKNKTMIKEDKEGIDLIETLLHVSKTIYIGAQRVAIETNKVIESVREAKELVETSTAYIDKDDMETKMNAIDSSVNNLVEFMCEEASGENSVIYDEAEKVEK